MTTNRQFFLGCAIMAAAPISIAYGLILALS